MARIKDTYVQLRMTHAEKEKLQEQATAARMKMSEYILALSEQKKIIVADELPEVCRQLIGIGTNVNQIARVANQTKSVSEKQLDLVNDAGDNAWLELEDGTWVRYGDVTRCSWWTNLIDTIKNSSDKIEV